MVVAWVVSRKTVDFEKKISLFTQEKRYLPRDRFTLTYGNLVFGGMDSYFFMKFGKFTKSMLMKRSVFDQRLESPHS